MKFKTGKKTGLKYFNINDIRAMNPCYDPNKYLSEDFRGTAVDILEHPSIPFPDKLWVVMRQEILSEKCVRLFAVWSARQVQSAQSDDRIVNCTNVAERYANGQATLEELSAARSAAWSAAESAAESAARSAARSAAWSAAESAAESAARSAAWSAAESAAESAARSAAWSAAESAAESAARSAAESAARSAQQVKLIEMVKADALQMLNTRKGVK